MTQMNYLQNRNRLRHRKQAYGYQRRKVAGINLEFEIN